MQVTCNKIDRITTGTFTTWQTLSEAAESEITHSKATKAAKKVSNENLEPAVSGVFVPLPLWPSRPCCVNRFCVCELGPRHLE